MGYSEYTATLTNMAMIGRAANTEPVFGSQWVYSPGEPWGPYATKPKWIVPIEMNLEESTRLYYEVYASEYSESTYKAGLKPTWDLLSGRLRPGSLILDLGSGSGRDLHYYSTRGFNVVGLDYSLALLHLARSVSRCPVVLADIRALPFRERSFDAIWAVASLLHLRRETIPAVLAEVGRLLQSDGLLLTSVKEGLREEIDSLGRYTTFYQQEEWESLLGASDFAIIHSLQTTELRQRMQEGPKPVSWITFLAQLQT